MGGAILIMKVLASALIVSYGSAVNLYGDIEKLGYLYAELSVGDSEFSVIFDTGSSRPMLPCTGCDVDSCGALTMETLLKRGKQCEDLKCSDLDCASGCVGLENGEPDWCTIDEQFDGGQFFAGLVTRATMQVFSKTFKGTVNCALQISEAFQNQYADGVFGMAASSAFMKNETGWSLCTSPPGFFGGHLTIGASVPDSNGVPWSDNYAFPVKDVFFNSISISNHLMGRINTGSPLSWMPKSLFNAAKESFFAFCAGKNAISGKTCGGFVKNQVDPQSMVCVDISKSIDFKSSDLKNKNRDLNKIFDSFPKFQISLSEKQSIPISATQYLFLHSGTTYCVGLIENTDSSNMGITIGLNVLRGLDVSFQILPKPLLSIGSCTREFPSTYSDDEPSQHYAALAFVLSFFSTLCSMFVLISCAKRLWGPKYIYSNLHEPADDHTEVELTLARQFSIGSLDDDITIEAETYNDDEEEVFAEKMDLI